MGERCSPECDVFIEQHGMACEKKELLLEADLFPEILIEVENGTLNESELAVMEALLQKKAM